MVSACRAIGQRLSKGGHSRRHLGGAHSYTLPLTTCLQRRHEMQLLLGAYNSWGEAATPFKQTKRTHNRQVIQFSVWWAPGKSVLNSSATQRVTNCCQRVMQSPYALWYPRMAVLNGACPPGGLRRSRRVWVRCASSTWVLRVSAREASSCAALAAYSPPIEQFCRRSPGAEWFVG